SFVRVNFFWCGRKARPSSAYRPTATQGRDITSYPAATKRMQLSKFLDDIVVWAPAKVNLFLEVLGKRADGYHEIATLMAAIRLYDRLIFRMGDSSEITLTCSNTQLSTGPDNLVIRAARLLQHNTGCRRGARIRLIKRIPMAAGLAGGS